MSNMRNVFVVIFIVQIVCCRCQTYNARYDNLNIEMILSNKRVLNNYIKCVLDEGPCTPEGRELKANIPEAIRTNCARCTDAQKKFIRRGANYLLQNQPTEWSRIARKFDPTGEQTPKFRQFLTA